MYFKIYFYFQPTHPSRTFLFLYFLIDQIKIVVTERTTTTNIVIKGPIFHEK